TGFAPLFLGTTSIVHADRRAMTRRLIRSQPGVAKAKPTATVPTTTVMFAPMFTKATAEPGDETLASTAPVNTLAKGRPAASPSRLAANIRTGVDTVSASREMHMQPTSKLMVTARLDHCGHRSTSQPPTGRDRPA